MRAAPVTVRWGRADIRALRRFALVRNRRVRIFTAVFVLSWPLGALVSPLFFFLSLITAPLIVRLAVTALYGGRGQDAPSTLEVDGERLRVTTEVAGSSRREWVIERGDVERVDERGRLILIHLREGRPPRVALPLPPIEEHPEVLDAIRGLARP